MRRTSIIGAAVAAVVGGTALFAGSASAQSVLVTAARGSALPARAHLVTSLGPGLQAFTLAVPRGMTARRYAAALKRRSGVLGAQPNQRLHRSGLALACVDAPNINAATTLSTSVDAMSVVAPGPTAPVAVLDTGIDPAVPELSGRVTAGFNATGAATTGDSDGHGTEVAAVAAAAPGRFRGISPSTPVMPVTIYSPSSETTAAWVVKGIQQAVNAGASVINISSSNVATDVDPKDAQVLQQAITAAADRGVITVASAGNEGKNNAAIPGSLSHVITVGSATADGTRDAFSNYGPWLDVMSPGANLVLPAPLSVCPSGYGAANGTSFSAPAVAGAAALIKTLRAGLDASQFFDVVRMQAVKDLYTPGRDDDSGFGLLDVGAGSSGTAPVKQPTEIDDDVYWLKQNPKKHKTLMKSSKVRRAQLTSAVSPGKDPDDVFSVYLKRGETLTAEGVSSSSAGLLDVGIYSPRTGNFDISRGVDTYLLADSQGVTNSPLVKYRAGRTGTYFVSVDAPDLITPGDAAGGSTTLQAQTKYTLKLRKLAVAKKKKKKKK